MSEKQISFFDNFNEDLEPTETESDFNQKIDSELANAVIQSTDWTVTTIIDQIQKNRIQLSPQFQRRDAWTSIHKSKFIESLMLNFPIPQLVLAEVPNQKGKYIIIDGKQRLLSILQFAGVKSADDPFETLQLKGLEILNQFEGMTLSEIQEKNINPSAIDEFENRTIRTIVIRHWKTDEILYHIFLRLNTGSVQLSPQELRNALHPGFFAEFIDIYSGESPGLRQILKTDKPDFRMRDAEILLRYYAFRNFLNEYAGSIKNFLDNTTKRFNLVWEQYKEEINYEAKQFEEGIKIATQVFGENDVFRKWKDGRFTGSFNRAVFDIIIYYFSRNELQGKISENSEAIKRGFIDLSSNNTDFISSIETTTKSLGATLTRFAFWTQALNDILGEQLPVPRLENNRIQF